MTRRGDVHFNSHFKQLMFHKDALEKEEMINYFIEVRKPGEIAQKLVVLIERHLCSLLLHKAADRVSV